MSLSHRYRNFGQKQSSEELKAENAADDLEDQKLQAFEAGYQAGWDDATKARAEERSKLSADLAQNLLDMSFTYREAMSKMTTSLEPAMQEIINKLLPETMRATFSGHILEQVQSVLKAQLERPVEIVVHPDKTDLIEALLEEKIPDAFQIVGEPSLGEGQAFIRIGEDERQVDMDTVVKDISEAITAFFHEVAQEVEHG